MNFMILPKSVCFNYYSHLVQQFCENNFEKSRVWTRDNTSSNKIPVNQQMSEERENIILSLSIMTQVVDFFFHYTA